jgi:Flp pilus assembly pilin Flp
MFNQLTRKFKLKKIRSASGQGITEYACVIAFVSILVAIVFSLAKGGLQPALSAAFSSISSQLNALSKGGS